MYQYNYSFVVDRDIIKAAQAKAALSGKKLPEYLREFLVKWVNNDDNVELSLKESKIEYVVSPK